MPLTLNGTTGLSGVDGSVSTPALQGSDSNTGVYFPAADTVAIAAGGTEAFRATSGGNLSLTGTMAMGSSFLRNRIINGDMRIDQRNAGASGTSGGYTVDRFEYGATQSAKGTWQQNAGTVTPPVGFKNYWGFTSSSAYSVLAGDFFYFRQNIEGFNVSDLGWGAAGAQSITLSFWVRSSLTGTFGGSISNDAYNRAYPFTYSISSANTWEQKTITIAGDTTGTWATTNAIGMRVTWSLGVGTANSGTAGAWTATGLLSATGAVSVVGTNAATWYITGVQLEAGTQATPFERRLYGQELALCQRYYYKSFADGVAPADNLSGQTETVFAAYDTSNGQGSYYVFPVSMRATPTLTFYRALNRGATAGQWATYDGSWTSVTTTTPFPLTSVGFTTVGTRTTAFTTKNAYLLAGHFTASIEL